MYIFLSGNRRYCEQDVKFEESFIGVRKLRTGRMLQGKGQGEGVFLFVRKGLCCGVDTVKFKLVRRVRI